MRLIDAGIENRDLDAQPRVADATERVPGSIGIDERHRAIEMELVISQSDYAGDSGNVGKLCGTFGGRCDEDGVKQRIHFARDNEPSGGNFRPKSRVLSSNLLAVNPRDR